jgi:hypothetical protein
MEQKTMTFRSGTKARAAAALLATALIAAMASPAAAAPLQQPLVVTDPGDGVPRADSPSTYSTYPAIQDPGPGEGYFQPFWYDTDGRHIQAHGGQVVTVEEDGQKVYYWYGEDRTKGYWNSPGVSVYRSVDLQNWTNKGSALHTVSTKAELEEPYFDALYDTVDDSGQPRAERINTLNYHLNTTQAEDYTAIFERPKVLYNKKNHQWVMWWHSDGRMTPGGSTYSRSMAGVAVSDSPTGPFKMTGVYRMYNRTDYKACTQWAVPGQARDMTVFQDDDGTAYITYSSEENASLYVAKLNADYTNVEHTTGTDMVNAHQFSESGQFPYTFADGTANAPVRGSDFQIVKECGHLEAPAIFNHDGGYHVIASGATGWGPNPQTYYSAESILGSWIRGVEPNDAHENVAYNAIPESGDGLLSVSDFRRTTFGSQATNVLTLAPGKYVYMGDRWDEGKSTSTYVWLPITVGENGRLEMRNPAAEDPSRWSKGWDESYWDSHGLGTSTWSVVKDRLPDTVRRGQELASALPKTVSVKTGDQTADVNVAWSKADTNVLGTKTIVGTLAADANFTAGRQFTRTISVLADGITNLAPISSVTVSSRTELAPKLIDLDTKGKGWDDWTSGTYPRDSWLAFSWAAAQNLDSLTVHTFKDGAAATWPSKIAVEYRDSSGAWVSSTVSTTLAQDANSLAPAVSLDLSSLPDTTGIRLRLTTDANVWQSISDVEIWGAVPPANVCQGPDATVSASFHQTEWATLPATNACDGKAYTVWSTWTGGTPKETASFTLETSGTHRVDSLSFTNTEGSIKSVSVEYRDAEGQWRPTTAQGNAPAANNSPTTIPFDLVNATGLRLTFATPGSYLKIPEITVPERPVPKPAAITVIGAADMLVGDSVSLSAQSNPKDADQTVTWSSSDKSIATVSAQGVVTGVAAGKVTITAASVADPTVTAAVTIMVSEPAPKLELAVWAELKCAGPNALLAVTVINGDDVPVDVTMATAYGNKSLTGIKPGEKAFHPFVTRLENVPAGQVTIAAAAMVDGRRVDAEQAVNFPAKTC